jgi:hypothetical protein
MKYILRCRAPKRVLPGITPARRAIETPICKP